MNSLEESYEISSLFFSEKNNKKYSRLASAAVVIGAIKVKSDSIYKMTFFQI